MVSSQVDRREQIRAALAAVQGADFPAEAQALLGTLGYRSERVPQDESGGVDAFLSGFPAQNSDTKTEQAFRENAASVRILFQVADEEIAEAARELAPARQLAMMDSRGSDGAGFDTGNVKSFLFAAVELHGTSYPRGKYAEFTREINKRFPRIPAVVLFRTADERLTVAFVHVRLNKRNPDRGVLGSVSLIREIIHHDPHRAHVDILAELALGNRLWWMTQHGKPFNFDSLLAAWLDTLDTQELNNRFYNDLLGWFDRACREARFPTDVPKAQTPQEHIVRLITRLMFVWFIKEKRLVAEDLFVEEQVRSLLKDYDSANGDSYYRAVLQNLFFATLNTEISQREFSNVDDSTHRNFSRYRYEKEMSDPQQLLSLYEQTPFINGGLFDCLDSEEATRAGGWRIDCFTDNPRERRGYSIPNHLFFDDDDGLITLFNRYKFTVEENTPAEQEVALDPELLGKVFENLLAVLNPETSKNARKQTGSFYTPRPVVDYMVDEALVAALAQQAQPADSDSALWQERIRHLMDYNDAGEVFGEAETGLLIRAIAGLKVLDPAVGSGAFPMGVLHKLTLALRRLDPDNARWEALQKELAIERATSALDTLDHQQRDAELLEISDTFGKYRDSDFGRKLYLIQNSIYGVDIQPVACQIAKLRFFISLAIEQQPTSDPGDNYGIKPLPNLETRFVAANTLLGLEKPIQPFLRSEYVLKLERDLTANREHHFHAGARREKLRLRDKDKQLRGALETELINAEMPAPDAHKVAQWDPYDQNAQAEWFDAKYMFGITDGFNVVMGNPPYVQLQKDGGKLGNLYSKAGFTTFVRTGDIYQLFMEQGFRLLSERGVLSYITSNSWLRAEYGRKTRAYVAANHTPLQLLEMGKDVFEQAIVDAAVLIARNGKSDEVGQAVDMDRLADTHRTFPPVQSLWSSFKPNGERPWSALSSIEQSIMDKMLAVGTPLKEWDIAIYRGVTTGLNDAFIIDNQTKEALIDEDPKSAEVIKPVLRGRDIQRYQALWRQLWLIATFPPLALNIDDYPAVKRHLLSFGKQRLEQSGKRLPNGARSRKKTTNAWFEMQDTCAYHEQFSNEKLLWMDLTNRGRFAFVGEPMFAMDTTFMMSGSSLKYLCAFLNNKLASWFMSTQALTSGMGTARWKQFTVERIPIPHIPTQEQIPISALVDRILAAKSMDTDTSALELGVDSYVYELYGLTAEEVLLVEERS